MISCIHLGEQTKDILKLKSVSNTTIRDVANHLTFGGGDVGGLLLTAFKAICSIKSLIKQLRYQIRIEKIWSQMKSGKETTRKPSV